MKDRFMWWVLFYWCAGVTMGFGIGVEWQSNNNNNQSIQVATVKGVNGKMRLKEVRGLELPTFQEGKLISLFTAERGEGAGGNTMIFTSPRKTDFFPGTKQVESVISADKATIEFEKLGGVEYKNICWEGNLRVRRFIQKEKPND